MKTVGLMGGRRAGHGMGMGEAAFCRGPLLEYGGLEPILPFLGGRSDAACRVVIKTVGFMGGRRAVGGVFATRRFPRPPPVLNFEVPEQFFNFAAVVKPTMR